MSNSIKAYLVVLMIQCLTTTGLTVIHSARVLGTGYYLAILVAVILIGKLHYYIATLYIKDYYLNKEHHILTKSHLLTTMVNFYNLILVIIWLYI